MSSRPCENEGSKSEQTGEMAKPAEGEEDDPKFMLTRKQSKSKLSKQAEVESEEPPKLVLPSGGSVPKEKIQITVEARTEQCDDRQSAMTTLSPLSKSKLLRSHAMCGDDDTKLSTRSPGERQGSSKTSSMGSSLSAGSSVELTDSTGVNLEEFIVCTLHKNKKDRQMLFSLEEQMIRFIHSEDTVHRFPAMSSYNRMLVHRTAAWFGLEHNVDQSGTAIVITKNDGKMRIPDTRFVDYYREEWSMTLDAEPRRLLLRKGHASYEEVRPDEMNPHLRKVRSYEERETEYDRARARIFNKEDSSSEGFNESPLSDASLYTTSSSGMLHGMGGAGMATGPSGAPHMMGAAPWSSTDSSSQDGLPPGSTANPGSILYAVPANTAGPSGEHRQVHHAAMQQKACSFGGIPTGYHRVGELAKNPPQRSNTDSKEASARAGLVRQPAVPERIPMMVSTAAVRPSMQPTPPLDPGSNQVIFAVSNIENVPYGALLIDPNTGNYMCNSDGSLYRHDPSLLQQQAVMAGVSLMSLRSAQDSPVSLSPILLPHQRQQTQPAQMYVVQSPQAVDAHELSAGQVIYTGTGQPIVVSPQYSAAGLQGTAHFAPAGAPQTSMIYSAGSPAVSLSQQQMPHHHHHQWLAAPQGSPLAGATSPAAMMPYSPPQPAVFVQQPVHEQQVQNPEPNQSNEPVQHGPHQCSPGHPPASARNEQ